MKTENREKEYTGLMESLESRTVRGRDRERERNRQNYIPKNSNSKYSVLQVCVFNAHVLYKSFWGLTEVLSYFNALKERLHKLQNIFLTEYLSLRHRSVPTDSVLGTRPHRSVPTDSVLGFFSRRFSASSADSADVELVSQHITYLLDSKGFNVILTILDHNLKMTHFLPCTKDMTSEDTTNLVMHDVFYHHDLPDNIISDRGPQFISTF